MPYNVSDFPIETSEPKIEVTLPPGRHVFELVVVDSAGLKSLPDRVTVVIRKDKVEPPSITKMLPGFGVRGETGESTIYGENLIDPYEVKLLLNGQETAGVEAKKLAGGTVSTLPVVIIVKPKAALGPYDLVVSARGGTATSTPGIFRVVGKPVIREFKPTSSDRAEDTRLMVKGEHLQIEGEPWTAHRVEFLREGQPDPEISASISEEGSGPQELVVHVKVKRNAALGDRIVRITTPAGSVESPASMVFRITERR